MNHQPDRETPDPEEKLPLENPELPPPELKPPKELPLLPIPDPKLEPALDPELKLLRARRLAAAARSAWRSRLLAWFNSHWASFRAFPAS